MRGTLTTLFILTIAAAPLQAQIAPQTVQPNETMADPGSNWFMSVSDAAGYVMDASTGEMHGLITLSPQTPVVAPSLARKEFYAAGSYYTRAVRGARTDVLEIYDFENLRAVAEVEIPPKIAAISYANYIGLLSGGRQVLVSNLTPAQSVTVVDVESRSLVGEVSTPGCSLILPVVNNDFLTICGDGTLMLVQLDESGNETGRERSRTFFNVQEDPVFDLGLKTATGWLLITNGGTVFPVTTTEDSVDIGDSWSLLTDEEREEGWWPGGRQFATVLEDKGILYVMMHQGEQYTHHESGTEVWVFGIESGNRFAEIEFEVPVTHLMVTQEDEPLLLIADEEGGTHVYDALKFRLERSIELPGTRVFVDL